jgi:hypothetical protein
MCLHQLLVAASVGALGGREQVRLTPLGSGSVAVSILFSILFLSFSFSPSSSHTNYFILLCSVFVS